MALKRKKWWKYLDRTVCSAIGVILLFFLQFLWWLAPPSSQVPIWTLYFLVIISFLVLAVMYGIIRDRSESRLSFKSIDVLQYSTYRSQIILIVDSNVELIYGMVVLIYHRGVQGEAELLIACGFVQSTSSSGYFQVEVRDFLVSGISRNDFEVRRIHPHDLIIKPYVLRDILG